MFRSYRVLLHIPDVQREVNAEMTSLTHGFHMTFVRAKLIQILLRSAGHPVASVIGRFWGSKRTAKLLNNASYAALRC